MNTKQKNRKTKKYIFYLEINRYLLSFHVHFSKKSNGAHIPCTSINCFANGRGFRSPKVGNISMDSCGGTFRMRASVEGVCFPTS